MFDWFSKKFTGQLPPVRNPPPMPNVNKPRDTSDVGKFKYDYDDLKASMFMGAARYEDCMRYCFRLGHWLGDNKIEVRWFIRKPDFVIQFMSHQDLIHFKLRWGEGPI